MNQAEEQDIELDASDHMIQVFMKMPSNLRLERGDVGDERMKV